MQGSKIIILLKKEEALKEKDRIPTNLVELNLNESLCSVLQEKDLLAEVDNK